MEPRLFLFEKITDGPTMLISIASFSTLLAILGAGIASLFSLRNKIVQKENRIAEIIKKKTDGLQDEITRLKKENALLDMLSSVANNTENCIIIADKEGEIQWANPCFTLKTGFTLENFKKTKGRTIAEASCHPDISNIIKESVQYRKSVTYETFVVSKFSQKFFISTVLTPIFNEDGELKMFLIVDTDISKYVLIKDNLEKVAQEFSDCFHLKMRKVA